MLWLGQSASTIGDRLVFVALALYVTEIGTPTDVGIVLAAHAIPLVAFLMLGGVWADRLPRHKVMVATDVDPRGAHALLAVLIFTGAVEIWHIVVIEAVFGAAEAFFRPAYTGLMPQTVPEDLLQDANAATALVNTVAEFAGPALATALVLGHRRRLGVRARRRDVPRLRRLPDPRRARAGAARSSRRARCSPSCGRAGTSSAPARGCGRRSRSSASC